MTKYPNKFLVCSLLMLAQLAHTEEPTMALLGGRDALAPYAAALLQKVPATITPLSLGFTTGRIYSTALNDQGFGLVGGIDLSSGLQNYAAGVSPTRQCTPLVGLPLGDGIVSVALNESNLGLIGGSQPSANPSFNNAYAALVSPDLSLTPIPLGLTNGEINSVAINDANLGLVGGLNILSTTPLVFRKYAAYISSGSVISIPVDPHSLNTIVSVALSEATTGLVGGDKDTNRPYASFVFLDSATLTPSVLEIELPTGLGFINSVALANATTGLIGGRSEDIYAYAAFVTSNSSIPNPVAGLPEGEINTVALNDLGQGLIGGKDNITNRAYAAFVSPGAAPISLPGLPIGSIDTVAINRFNQGLIGGRDSSNSSAYAALVLPNGLVTPLSLGITTGRISSVAINSFFLSQLPTTGLHGNNLRFANYINANAPEDAFYFLPSLLDGTYEEALKSAAPTRNAISLNTAMQNTFYLTTTLATHLRDARMIRSRSTPSRPLALAEPAMPNEEHLVAARKFSGRDAKKAPKNPTPPPYTLWFDAIGAFAYQKSQHQTPGFNPSTAGACLAFDKLITEHTTVGGGVSYLYTHVHEKHGAGSSNINQEDLFVYASWENDFYVDGALWGGLFQTDQIRKIHMTGFDFTSTSHPDGGQLVPHLELGYLATTHRTVNKEITWNPFGMLDWSNAWQESFKEKGDSPFNTHQNSRYASLLRAEIGLRVGETLFFDTWNLIFQEKASYVNTQVYGAGKVQGFLVGSPGSFTLETLTSAQNLGVVQFLMTAAPFKASHPSTTLFYQGEFSPQYQSHQLNLELAWTF